MSSISDKKEIRKQLIKNIFLNFIIFTLILLIFDVIIYKQITLLLYEDIDQELEMQSEEREQTFESQTDYDMPEIDGEFDDTDIAGRKVEKIYEEYNNNPRLIVIERDENENITNSDTLGSIINYDISFDSSSLNSIYNIQISGEYYYRGINYQIMKDGEVAYIQVLANIDGEVNTINNIVKILIIGTLILVVISIVASYILSKRAMAPIIKAYEKQTEFVQNASHELRTPLAIIQAKEELLLTEPNKKIIEKSEDINLMLKETRRLTKLIKELMDLARADNQNIEIQKELTDINALIKEVTEPYVELASMQNKTIEFDLKYGKKVSVDKNRFSELLIIILDNAIKYTNASDKIVLKTYAKDGKCNIEIQDTGIGISDNAIAHIFDRFYREDKARSRKTGGNGLGLSIAKMIVNLHGGNISASHNLPKGTIIKIRI